MMFAVAFFVGNCHRIDGDRRHGVADHGDIGCYRRHVQLQDCRQLTAPNTCVSDWMFASPGHSGRKNTEVAPNCYGIASV